MYTTENFKTKKALKEAVSAHKNGTGPAVTLYAPGYGEPKEDGIEYVSGPHAPKPHTWYAQCTMENGVVVGVK